MPISSNKKEVEKKKEQKRKEKLRRKEERKRGGTSSFDDMIVYMDEFGNFTDTPPQPRQEVDAETIQVSTPQQEDVATERPQGTIDFFNAAKGFGFIRPNDGKERYFFHISQAPANIAEGNRVTFDLEKTDRGLSAINIEKTK